MRRFSFFAAPALALALLALPRDAAANGRFPEANAIFVSESHPELVLLRVTFGLMASRDHGKTWGWVCEQTIGSAGVEDPMYAITPSGRIMASTFQGLTQTSDDMCTFTFAGGELNNLVFVDLAEYAKDKKQVVTFASSYDKQDEDGGIMFRSQLYETKDEGATWKGLGAPFDPYMLGETVDYAPSDPNRIYVSGILDPGVAPKAIVLVTSDHGAKWDTYTVPLLENERALFLAAVDPTNPDRVYARTQNAVDRPGRLLVSNDAGKTWQTAFTSKGGILGFAIANDGKKVWLGGPLDGVQLGTYDGTNLVFAQKSAQPVQCLKQSADGLWACSTEKSGFVAGFSKDEGATWEPKLHFCDVQGALACPAGSPTHDRCGPAWNTQKGILGCTTASDGGTDDASTGDASTPPPTAGDDETLRGGCRCTTANVSSPWTAALASAASVAVALAFAARRRRR